MIDMTPALWSFVPVIATLTLTVPLSVPSARFQNVPPLIRVILTSPLLMTFHPVGVVIVGTPLVFSHPNI
jgi:hypothetical protein